MAADDDPFDMLKPIPAKAPPASATPEPPRSSPPMNGGTASPMRPAPESVVSGGSAVADALRDAIVEKIDEAVGACPFAREIRAARSTTHDPNPSESPAPAGCRIQPRQIPGPRTAPADLVPPPSPFRLAPRRSRPDAEVQR
jgi:hypothetical protein